MVAAFCLALLTGLSGCGSDSTRAIERPGQAELSIDPRNPRPGDVVRIELEAEGDPDKLTKGTYAVLYANTPDGKWEPEFVLDSLPASPRYYRYDGGTTLDAMAGSALDRVEVPRGLKDGSYRIEKSYLLKGEGQGTASAEFMIER